MFKVFCRIPLDEPVPNSTTLIKLNHKYCVNAIARTVKKIKKIHQEAENGIISNFAIFPGNPRDDTLLEAAVSRHIKFMLYSS